MSANRPLWPADETSGATSGDPGGLPSFEDEELDALFAEFERSGAGASSGPRAPSADARSVVRGRVPLVQGLRRTREACCTARDAIASCRHGRGARRADIVAWLDCVDELLRFGEVVTALLVEDPLPAA